MFCKTGEFQPEAASSSCEKSSPGHFVHVRRIDDPVCMRCRHLPAPARSARMPCRRAQALRARSRQRFPDARRPRLLRRKRHCRRADPCPPGTYQPEPGQVDCLQAEPGFFVSASASSAQQVCPDGSFTTEAGADSVIYCTVSAPGFFENSGPVFLPCPPGYYQPLPAQPGCLAAAEPGHFVQVTATFPRRPPPPASTSKTALPSRRPPALPVPSRQSAPLIHQQDATQARRILLRFR